MGPGCSLPHLTREPTGAPAATECLAVTNRLDRRGWIPSGYVGSQNVGCGGSRGGGHHTGLLHCRQSHGGRASVDKPPPTKQLTLDREFSHHTRLLGDVTIMDGFFIKNVKA